MTRLIDADALKVNEAHYDEEGVRIFYENEIDNAPTVTKDYDTGYQDGLEDGFNDIRPQGEWIYRENENDKYETYICSCCGKEITVDATKFCDIGFTIEDFECCLACGAKMDGGEE